MAAAFNIKVKDKAGLIKLFFSNIGVATAAPSVSPAYTIDPSVPNYPLSRSRAFDISLVQPGRVP